MAEPILDASRVVSGIGQGIAAGVAEHVGVDREGEACALADALDQSVDCVGRERAAALGREDEGRVRALPAQSRAEMLPAGAMWWMARGANAALMALHLSGVPFLKPWEPPPIEPWEGPFADPHQRLPQEPTVAAERRATLRAWRERHKRAPESEKLATESGAVESLRGVFARESSAPSSIRE